MDSDDVDDLSSAFDDTLTLGTGSISLGDDDERYLEPEPTAFLGSAISELKEFRSLSTEKRESTLFSYLRRICHSVPQEHVEQAFPGILKVLLYAIKSGRSLAERCLALHALSVSAIVHTSDATFNQVVGALRPLCRGDAGEAVTVGALLTLAVVAIYGGALEDETFRILDFLVEIIETDGVAAQAEDSVAVVKAAMQAWGFIATHMEDLSDHASDALDTFVEQLDSSSVEIQGEAGANIALIFEESRTLEEEGGEPFNLRHDAGSLVRRMKELVRQTAKQASRKDRRQRRADLSSVVTSLELGKGPKYSTAGRPAFNPHTGGQKMEGRQEFEEAGHRERLKFPDGSVIIIDSWSLAAKVSLLKDLLKGGFITHLTRNIVLREDLGDAEVFLGDGPVPTKESQGTKSGAKKSGRSRKGMGL